MKCVLAIGGVTLLLVACSPTDPCRSHSDEASCVADSACQWKAEKSRCKAKKEKKSPQSKQTTTPAPSERAATPTEQVPSAAPDAKYPSPSTETQPQPVYPGGEP